MAIGESSVAIYTDNNKDSPKVSSWIKDKRKASEAIDRIEKIDKGQINLIDYDDSVPDIIYKLSLPIFAKSSENFEMLSKQLQAHEETLIKLTFHENIYELLKNIADLGEADKVSTDIKIILEKDPALKKQLSDLKSEQDIVGKLTLLRSSISLIVEIQKCKSISEKKEVYSKYFRNNPLIAELFAGADYFEATSKITYEAVSLLLLGTYIMTKDAEILSLYKDFSKIGRGLIVVIEGVKIIKNIILIINDFINGKGLSKQRIKEIMISIATIIFVLKLGEAAALSTALLILEAAALAILGSVALAKHIYGEVVGGSATYVIREEIKDIDENFEKVVIKYINFKYLLEQVYRNEGFDEQQWIDGTRDDVEDKFRQFVATLIKFADRARGYKEQIVTRILNSEKISEFNSLLRGLDVGNLDDQFLIQKDVIERLYAMLHENIIKIHKEFKEIVQAQMTDMMREYKGDSEISQNISEDDLSMPSYNIAEFERYTPEYNIASSISYGQKQLNKIKSKVAHATNNEFTASNWFQHIIYPLFLGHKIKQGVHLLLWRKLQEAQTWLLAQPQYKGMTPVQLGRALGLDRPDMEYSGARLSKDNQAMHSFGLAIDIDRQRHSWIGAGWVQYDKEKLKERHRMLETLRKASGERLPGSNIFEYLHSIAQSAGTDTRAAYSVLKKRHDEFIAYLQNNPAELRYWKNSATFGSRDPLQGFLSLHPDLVYALREVAGLAWGAIDFGPRACGDIMHFDTRMSGVGQIIAHHIGGFIPSGGHPALSVPSSNEIWYEDEYEDADEYQTDYEYHEAIGEAEWEDSYSDEAEDDFNQ